MAEGQTYNIPETMLPWFREKLEKLNKKSLRLVGEKVYCTVIGYHFLDGEGHQKLQKMKIFEVFVAHPEVKLNGWQFVARIDHSQEAGNVVRVVPGMELPERYRHTSHICEHCKENRYRRDTFVLTCAETGEFKQVGSSCLKDFTGHNGANKYAQLAEVLAIIGDYSRGVGFGRSSEHVDYRWFNAHWFLALTADSVIQSGWTSAAYAKEHAKVPTKSKVLDLVFTNATPSNAGLELADKAIEWAQAFGDDGAELNDWQYNCRVVAQSEALEERHLGIAASIVGVYWNRFVRPAGEPQKISDYVGKEGEKITVGVTLKVANAGETSVRHVFEDADGNILLWFASGDHFGRDGLLGKTFTIAGTVKKHQIYNGTKQTLINRVKVKAAS